MKQVDFAFLRRAQKLIQVRRASDIPNASKEEAKLIQSTNDWFSPRGQVLGVSVGLKHSGGQRSGEPCVRVFVRKKGRVATNAKRLIKPFRLRGRTVLTDVVELRKIELHVSVGDPIGAPQNIGSIAGFLTNAAGRFFALTAAHVIGSTFGSTTAQGTHQILKPGAPLVTSGLRRFAVLHDRRIFDFTGQFPGQNVDAAIALIDDPASLPPDRSSIPYRSSGWCLPGASVALWARVNRAGTSTGVVSDANLSLDDPRFLFADPSGRLRPLSMSSLCLADYTSAKGDSGGAVVDDSERLVGMHIGAATTSDGVEAPIFTNIPYVLSSWPSLRLVVNE